MDKFITFLANKFLGKMVTKGVTILASILVTKGLLDAAHYGSWAADTAQIVTGGLMMGVSFYLSQVTHAKQQSLADTALNVKPGTMDSSIGNKGIFPQGVVSQNQKGN